MRSEIGWRDHECHSASRRDPRTDETFTQAQQRPGIPTRKDIDLLNRRIEKLTAASPAKPRPRRPASRTVRKHAPVVTIDAD